MNLPSFVRFFSGGLDLELDFVLEELREPTEVPRGDGPYGDGRDDAEERAGACCRPRGSLRLCTLERRMTEPEGGGGQLALRWCSKGACVAYLALRPCLWLEYPGGTSAWVLSHSVRRRAYRCCLVDVV